MLEPNQLYRELLAILGMNPWVGYNSSSRAQMMASQMGQALVVKGATLRRCQTGMEREYGKYTFSIRMPCNGTILHTIDRYGQTLSADSFKLTPESIIIYEDADTGELGAIDVRQYCSHHQHFGFDYQLMAPGRIIPNKSIAKGTILYDSISKTTDGGYKYGVECNVAFMTMPAGSEDGILISKSCLRKFQYKTYETRVISWGGDKFPINAYGTDDQFKAFPDIGEWLREDGVLMCLRTHDPLLAPVEQNIRAMQKIDPIFDEQKYAAGPGGRVIDIRVYRGQVPTNAHSLNSQIFDEQISKYLRAKEGFHQTILEIYNQKYRLSMSARNTPPCVTPEFHRLLTESLNVVPRSRDGREKESITRLYRQIPIDEWRVEFVIEYTHTPDIGHKLTDLHGGKGVVCYTVVEDEDMPVDSAGNRAEIVMDPYSTINRMNLGRLYEQYINAASRDVTKNVVARLGFPKGHEIDIRNHISRLTKENPELIDAVWKYLMGYYSIVVPEMYRWYTEGQYKLTPVDHLTHIVMDGIYLYTPPETEVEWKDVIPELEKYYPPTYGPVTYRAGDGKMVTTTRPVRIGSLYIILLEKTGDDWSAVASGKRQHMGILSQITAGDKWSQPTRQNATRALGETEVRIYRSYAGGEVTAEIHDRNNNLEAHRAIVENLLTADQPTNIERIVDRDKIPLGGGKPQQIIRHIGQCGGWKFVCRPQTKYRR